MHLAVQYHGRRGEPWQVLVRPHPRECARQSPRAKPRAEGEPRHVATEVFLLVLVLGFGSLPVVGIFGRELVGQASASTPRRPIYYFYFLWFFVSVLVLCSVAGFSLLLGEDLAVGLVAIALALVIWTWLAGVVASFAFRRGQSWVRFFWLTALLSPVVTPIILVVLSRNQQVRGL